jgi:hypothetical protein
MPRPQAERYELTDAEKRIDEPRKETGSAGILPAGSGFQPELLDIFGNDTMTLVPVTVG